MAGKTTSVRHTVKQNNNILGLLGQFAAGMGTGMIQGAQQGRKDMISLLPVLAQMKMIEPGGKAGDKNVISVGGMNFKVTKRGQDLADEKNKLAIEAAEIELGKRKPNDTYLMNKAVQDSYDSGIYQAKLAEADIALAGGDVDGYNQFKTEAERIRKGEVASIFKSYQEVYGITPKGDSVGGGDTGGGGPEVTITKEAFDSYSADDKAKVKIVSKEGDKVTIRKKTAEEIAAEKRNIPQQQAGSPYLPWPEIKTPGARTTGATEVARNAGPMIKGAIQSAVQFPPIAGNQLIAGTYNVGNALLGTGAAPITTDEIYSRQIPPELANSPYGQGLRELPPWMRPGLLEPPEWINTKNLISGGKAIGNLFNPVTALDYYKGILNK